MLRRLLSKGQCCFSEQVFFSWFVSTAKLVVFIVIAYGLFDWFAFSFHSHLILLFSFSCFSQPSLSSSNTTTTTSLPLQDREELCLISESRIDHSTLADLFGLTNNNTSNTNTATTNKLFLEQAELTVVLDQYDSCMRTGKYVEPQQQLNNTNTTSTTTSTTEQQQGSNSANADQTTTSNESKQNETKQANTSQQQAQSQTATSAKKPITNLAPWAKLAANPAKPTMTSNSTTTNQAQQQTTQQQESKSVNQNEIKQAQSQTTTTTNSALKKPITSSIAPWAKLATPVKETSNSTTTTNQSQQSTQQQSQQTKPSQTLITEQSSLLLFVRFVDVSSRTIRFVSSFLAHKAMPAKLLYSAIAKQLSVSSQLDNNAVTTESKQTESDANANASSQTTQRRREISASDLLCYYYNPHNTANNNNTTSASQQDPVKLIDIIDMMSQNNKRLSEVTSLVSGSVICVQLKPKTNNIQKETKDKKQDSNNDNEINESTTTATAVQNETKQDSMQTIAELFDYLVNTVDVQLVPLPSWTDKLEQQDRLEQQRDRDKEKKQTDKAFETETKQQQANTNNKPNYLTLPLSLLMKYSEVLSVIAKQLHCETGKQL